MRTLNVVLNVQTTTLANSLLYYWRKLPWLGSLSSDQLYSHQRIKRFVAILAKLLLIIWGFCSRLAYVGLLLYLPVVMIGAEMPKEAMLHQFVHLFVLISFIVAGVSNAMILEPKRAKYVAVKLMRMSPSRYMKTMISYRYVTFLVYLLPAMLLFGMMLGAAPLQMLLLTLAAVLWRVGCEYLHLRLFEKTGTVLIKQTGIVWIVIVLGYVAAYLPLLTKWPSWIGAALLTWPVPLVIALLGSFAAFQLARYADYRAVVDAATKRDDPLLDLGRVFKEANQASVRSKASDYALGEQQNPSLLTKQGYPYLNALFFLRHRSLVKRPIHVRLIVVGVLCLFGVGLVMILEQETDFLITSLDSRLSILILAINYLAVGEHICKAIFHHCDQSLMRYSFYRRDAVQHFRVRLYLIANRNLLIAGALAAALTLVYAFAGGNVIHHNVLLLWISCCSLALFYSVHHLFMYYILQPYTAELNIKNPLYYVIYYIISFIGGISLFLQIPSLIFTCFVILISLLYLLVALLLVNRYGSRTFRLK